MHTTALAALLSLSITQLPAHKANGDTLYATDVNAIIDAISSLQATVSSLASSVASLLGATTTTTTTLALTAGSTSSLYGDSLTFTATVTSSTLPTGTVRFMDASTQASSCSLNNGSCSWTTTTLAVGAHSLTAQYLGDGSHSASTSGIVTQAVASSATALDHFVITDLVLAANATQTFQVTWYPPLTTDKSLNWRVCSDAPASYSSTTGHGWTCTAGGSGYGTINASTGAYTAPATVGSYGVVACQGAIGGSTSNCDYGYATVGGTSGGAIAISPSSASVGLGVYRALTVAGGTPPYRWKTNRCGWVSSVGNGSGGAPSVAGFNAPELPTSCTVTVTDSTSPTPLTGTATMTVVGTPTGTIRYVSHSGNDSTGDGSAGSPWATIGKARTTVSAGTTVYIRGTANADTEQNCTANTGACWMETDNTTTGGVGVTSPLHWMRNEGHAGTYGNPITFRGYPGETVIIQVPAGNGRLVTMEPIPTYANCSYLAFENLIFDGRGSASCAIRADPATGDNDAPSTMCRDIRVTNSKIRHGYNTGGATIYGMGWTFDTVEVYENGNASGGSGDHDHGYYFNGTQNTVYYGRVHHNIQGIQVWNSGAGATTVGNSIFQGVEIDHNGVNTFLSSNNVRLGSLGDLGLYYAVGSGAVLDRINVHDNTHYGISIGADWSSSPASTGVSLTNSWIWGNGTNAVYLGSGSSYATNTGNVNTAP
jgi:hypothetical protein